MSIADPARVSLLSLTPGGQELAERIQALWPVKCYCAEKYLKPGFTAFSGSFATTLAEAFARDEAIIVIGACGIVVRTLAPLVQDKLHDPAVLVMDEKGQHVISLLSGHIGGANELACQLAARVGATPVITTATDVNQICAIDVLVKQLGATMVDFREAVKVLNQALVSGEKVGIYFDQCTIAWLDLDLNRLDLRGLTQLEQPSEAGNCDHVLLVSMQQELGEWSALSNAYHIVPQRLVVGMGCRRDLEPSLMAQSFAELLQERNWHPLALTQFVSIDVKHDEPAILQLAQQYYASLSFFSAAQLNDSGWSGPESEFVRKTVGVGAVSQPSAWIISQGCLVGDTVKQQGMTFTFGVKKACYTW